jgi:pimeloyl-ACP methyl ester carboxylesterase
VTHRTVHHNGCELAWQVQGHGPPVVFIQGVGLHGRGWQPQVTELATHYTCLTFDNRGAGASLPAPRVLSMAAMTEDTLRIMDAVGWDSAHLVGHSMGGCIAMGMALRARHRVRSLSLLCTFARGRDATRLTKQMLWVGIRSSIGTLRSRRRAFLELVLAPDDLSPAERDALAMELEPLFGHDLAYRPAIAMKQLAALRGYDATPHLHRLEGLPTLVLSAAHDAISPPAIGRALAAAIPGADYVEVAGQSHGVTIRHAREVNALLARHFAGAEGSFLASR